MPRLTHQLPQMRLHKSSGRAKIRIHGKDYYLGKFGSPEAKQEYDQFIFRYLANGRQVPSEPVTPPAVTPPAVTPPAVTPPTIIPPVITVTSLIKEFSWWAKTNYRHPDGTFTREHENFLHVTDPLGKMFGGLPVAEFGSAKLMTLRDVWIQKKLARKTINAMTRRVQQVFKWGVSREIIPLEVWQRLLTVESLRLGRGGRETSGVRGSVPWEIVAVTLPHLPPLIQAFVTILFYTGARVGELSKLTTGMIDRSESIWMVDLSQHKTSHKDRCRRIVIGKTAQDALLPYLSEKKPDAPIFSPHNAGENRGKRHPGKRHQAYTVHGLSRLLSRAVTRSGVTPWTLAQLRHSAACRITKECGIEKAAAILGHASIKMTRLYAQDSIDQIAMEVAERMG